MKSSLSTSSIVSTSAVAIFALVQACGAESTPASSFPNGGGAGVAAGGVAGAPNSALNAGAGMGPLPASGGAVGSAGAGGDAAGMAGHVGGAAGATAGVGGTASNSAGGLPGAGAPSGGDPSAACMAFCTQ